jgi:Peroxidase, family 2
MCVVSYYGTFKSHFLFAKLSASLFKLLQSTSLFVSLHSNLKMRYLFLHGVLAALPLSASAFPHVAEGVATRLTSASPRRSEKRTVTFDPAAQLVDVTSEHAFVPPNFAAGDQRGPCPGLNALANHNYLPHNGVAACTDITNQTVSGILPLISHY